MTAADQLRELADALTTDDGSSGPSRAAAIDRIRALAQDVDDLLEHQQRPRPVLPAVDLPTLEEVEAAGGAIVQVYPSADGWRWRFCVAGIGHVEILADGGQGYEHKMVAYDGMLRVVGLPLTQRPDITVVEVR